MTQPKKNPLITIGIPTYNRADAYLKDALESALNQTYQNIEILVSDNCSPDQTEKLVSSYSHPALKYVRHSENLGAMGNWNYIVNNAAGEYLLLLHDDDIIDPDFLETCMDGFDAHTEVGIIRSGVRVIDGEGKEKRSLENTIDAETITDFVRQFVVEKRTVLYMCSVLYNTGALQKTGGFSSKENLLIDNVAELKLTAEMGRRDVRPVKASFRIHGENMGGKSSITRWAEDSKYVIDLIDELIDDKKLVEEATYNYCRWNYNRARRITSPLNRWQSYFANYKAFNYNHSPFYYKLKPVAKKILK